MGMAPVAHVLFTRQAATLCAISCNMFNQPLSGSSMPIPLIQSGSTVIASCCPMGNVPYKYTLFPSLKYVADMGK